MKKEEKKKKKKKSASYYFWDILTKAAFIVMILALLYPFVSESIENQRRGTITSKYENAMNKKTQAELDRAFELSQKYNEALFDQQEGRPFTPVDYRQIFLYNPVMAYLEIPALKMDKMPIYLGTSMNDLDKGLGHLEHTSIPVGGDNTRAVITGHSGLKNQILFSDLNKLEKGDVFYVHIFSRTIAYQVDQIETIRPEEVDKVKIIPGKDLATLLTCTPIGINSHRLLVTGKHIPYSKKVKKKAPVVQRNFWNIQNIGLLIAFLLILLFILFKLFKMYQKRRDRKKQEELEKQESKRQEKAEKDDHEDQ
ncbi:class C sortase [Enterococcus hirae]|nr:class C sortase [Enterococcus hirae]